MMLRDPQMIRQTARYLAEQLRSAGYGQVRVRAVASISFNGRRKQHMVDPKVDLAAQREGWGSASWIVPLARQSRVESPEPPARRGGLARGESR